MTPALLAATLRNYIETDKALKLGFAVFSPETWAGPPEMEVSGRSVRVKYCRSMLEMRESLCAWDHAVPLAMLTPVENHLLAADLRSRVFKRSVLDVDVWSVLESNLGLRFIDAKVRADRVLGNALLEVVARQSVPPPVSGVLYEDAVWDLILPARFGLSGARADLNDLLVWARSGGADHRSLWSDNARLNDPELWKRMQDWFIGKLGQPAKAIFDCRTAGADPLAVGLSYEPHLSGVNAEPARTELARGFGRMERFTNHEAVPFAAAREWHTAAQAVMPKMSPSDVAEVIDGVDRILPAVGIERYAWLSRWSRLGAAQALDRFAESPTEIALDDLQKRHWPAANKGILDRAAMALRLNRWLEMPDSSWMNFQSAVNWYRSEGSWVDWARSRLRFVSESSKWNAAATSILDRARARREAQNRRFAELLSEWTCAGSPPPVLGVESVLESYVAPLAEDKPVLLIVMDGMSQPNARELESELTSRRWNLWSNTQHELSPVVAALPSVTQFSRTSLLAGRLVSGSQDTETRLFTSRSDLRRPALFHKDDLAPASDEVLREIADTDRRVVGVVINAIDDELGGSRQVSPDWSLEYLAVLRGILAEAATAGRVVVLTSDHGHSLDTGSTRSRSASATSDRWRVGAAEDDDELRVSGSRVLSGSEFVGLAVESTRYLRPKVGYHGGLTPQETLVPLMVLAQPSVTIRGWQQVVPESPSWWSAGASPQQARQGHLFSTDRAATEGSGQSTWLDELVASDIFKAQLAATNGRVSADHVEQTVRALDGSGGRLLKGAFGGCVGITPGRVSSYIAAVQRVLNVDGYGILELDETSQTVTLNRQLLLKQFRLE